MSIWRRFRSILDSPSMIAGGRFAQTFLSLASVPIVARVLGPDGRGIQATVLATIVVVQSILTLGVPLAMRRRVAIGERRSEVIAAGRLYLSFLFIPAFLLAVPLDVLLFADLLPSERIAFYISMALLPLTISWNMEASVLVATHEYRRIALLNLIAPVASLLFIITIWLLGILNVATAIYSSLFGNVLASIISYRWIGGAGAKRTLSVRTLMREGLSLVGGRIADIASKRADQIIVLPLLGARSAGLYSIAVAIGALPLALSQALGAAVFNGLTEGDAKATRQAIRHAMAILLVAAAVLEVAVYFLVPFIFGVEFVDAIPVTMVTVAGSIFAGVGFVCTMALAAQKRGRQMTGAQLIGALTGLVLLYPFGGYWGAIGAATAVGIGAITTTAILFRFLNLSLIDALPRPRDFIGALRTLFRAGPVH